MYNNMYILYKIYCIHVHIYRLHILYDIYTYSYITYKIYTPYVIIYTIYIYIIYYMCCTYNIATHV